MIKRFWHWLLDLESWRVVYKSGDKGLRMTWRTANEYATIFGSTHIIFDPE